MIAVAFTLALLLVWAPLPFGSVTAAGRLVLSVGSFLALLMALAARPSPSTLRRLSPSLRLFAAFCLLGLVQSLPLPRFLVGLVSPAHGRMFRQAGELLDASAGSWWASLSLAPSVTRGVAVWGAALIAALVAAAAVGRQRSQRRIVLAGVLAGALVQVVYGARRWLDDPRIIWGREVVAVPDRLRGTYVSPNHLATFLAIAMAGAFAWTWWAVRRSWKTEQWERRLFLVIPPAFIWLTLFSTLALTGSRAGLLAVLSGTLAQGALLWQRERHRRRAWIVLAAALVVVGLAAAYKFEWLGRVTATSIVERSVVARAQSMGLTLSLWSRFPVTGTGLGAFREGFPLVQPPNVPGNWWHAHCDWLELLATAGIFGAGLFVAGLFFLVRRIDRVLQNGVRSEDRAAAVAALGAVVAVAVQEVFDFGLVLPANAFALTVLCGAAAGVPAGGARDETEESSRSERVTVRRRRSRRSRGSRSRRAREVDAVDEPAAGDRDGLGESGERNPHPGGAELRPYEDDG